MTNITLALEEEIVRKVRKLAVERNTSLTALVRETLRQLAAREDVRTEERVAELMACFDSAPGKVGKKAWTREELHER
jgi:predicted transcriptional regulator